MKRVLSNLIVLVVIGFLFAQCANRGTPSGGEKDVTPPIITKSEPKNYSTNFKATEIKIYFDEYIKIKDLQKQLIISPPMNLEPEVTPLGTASKYITIKIANAAVAGNHAIADGAVDTGTVGRGVALDAFIGAAACHRQRHGDRQRQRQPPRVAASGGLAGWDDRARGSQSGGSHRVLQAWHARPAV